MYVSFGCLFTSQGSAEYIPANGGIIHGPIRHPGSGRASFGVTVPASCQKRCFTHHSSVQEHDMADQPGTSFGSSQDPGATSTHIAKTILAQVPGNLVLSVDFGWLLPLECCQDTRHVYDLQDIINDVSQVRVSTLTYTVMEHLPEVQGFLSFSRSRR